MNTMTNAISEEFQNKIWIYFESNLKPRTRKEYWNVVNNFTKQIGHDPLTLTNKEAITYYEYLLKRISTNKLSYTTGVMRLSVIRSVCNFIEYYMENHGINYTNHFKDISLPEKDKMLTEQDVPTSEEINNILETIKSNNDKKAFLILSLALKCALTNSEICNLNIEYIVLDSSGNMCINYPPKSSHNISRIIKLSDDIAKLLDEYIFDNNIREGAIFINKRKTRMKVRDSERLLEKYCKICLENNLIKNKYTMQTLRHAALSYMLSGGASKEDVASYAGITSKWITRYDRIITSKSYTQAIDYSIIKIN